MIKERDLREHNLQVLVVGAHMTLGLSVIKSTCFLYYSVLITCCTYLWRPLLFGSVSCLRPNHSLPVRQHHTRVTMETTLRSAKKEPEATNRLGFPTD